MTDFRVDLEVFRGPLDLLLYLVRKHELDIADIPIAMVADQYIAYLDVIEHLDVNAVGDFLEMATTLTEIKSRMVLPRGDEVDEEIEDPRQELVRQLLEYKKFKDAASLLDERTREWIDRFPRLANDLAPRRLDPADQPLHEVELWDLVSAFGRVLRESQAAKPSSIVYDETPIHVYMERIHARLKTQKRLAFSQLFEPGQHKSMLVGIFLAILELARHHQIRAEQNEIFGELWVLPGPKFDEPYSATDVETYEPDRSGDTAAEEQSEPPVKPR